MNGWLVQKRCKMVGLLLLTLAWACGEVPYDNADEDFVDDFGQPLLAKRSLNLEVHPKTQEPTGLPDLLPPPFNNPNDAAGDDADDADDEAPEEPLFAPILAQQVQHAYNRLKNNGVLEEYPWRFQASLPQPVHAYARLKLEDDAEQGIYDGYSAFAMLWLNAACAHCQPPPPEPKEFFIQREGGYGGWSFLAGPFCLYPGHKTGIPQRKRN